MSRILEVLRLSRLARSVFPIALWGVLYAFASLSVDAREIVDVTRTHVVIPDSPQRIVTLAPSLGELVADFLGTELGRIVGVSEYTDYPPALEKISTIGSYAHFSLERVFALKPDLVLATMDGNSRDQVLHLREMGLPVLVLDTRNFDQIAGSMRIVGDAVGKSQEGARMADRFMNGITRIRERTHRQSKRRVLLQIGDQPLVVVGGSTFLHQVVEQLGANNVYADAQMNYPRPSLEDVVRRGPDVIVVLALGKDLQPFKQMAERWKRFPQLSAVKNKRVLVVQGDPIVRPTLRLLEGLARLEKAIYAGE